MTRYTELTAAEKVALTEEDFNEAVKLEAAARGIELPITLDEAMKRKPYIGFTIPPNAVRFYEIQIPNQYGNPKGSGLCFATEAEATNASKGAFSIEERGYPVKQNVVCQGEFSVAARFVNGMPTPKTAQEHIETFEQDLTAFTALADECAKDWREVNQTAYNRQVQLRRRQTYLDLAKGDEAIAKGFWATTYAGVEWPVGD